MKKRNKWTRRWLIVNKGLLFLYKTWKETDPTKCANLLLCTVKQIASDRPHTLMVISQDLSLTFQASDTEDLKEWIQVIESGIGWQLSKKKEASSAKTEQKLKESFTSINILKLQGIAGNTTCADCGERSKAFFFYSFHCFLMFFVQNQNGVF